jgi:AAA domain
MATSSNPNLSAATKEWLDSFNATPDLYADVPQEMKDSPTWVVWRYEINAKGKKDKPPSNARDIDGPHASTTDPTTWVSFDEAVDVANRRDDIKGLGYVFQKDFQGSDLDGAVQTINGALVITPFARSIGKLAGSYCEFSPSRTGIHLIWKSPIPLPEGHKKGNHDLGGEIYDKDSPRYFTVTGDKVPGLSADSIATITDPNIIKLVHFLVLNTTNEKFVRLWTGAWQKAADAHGKLFPSQSEADLSLCGYLVRGGFNTAETLDAAFRQSGMMREEWSRTSQYTIPKALAGHEPDQLASGNKSTKTAELVFKFPPVTGGTHRDWVFDPSLGMYEGLFPRGAVSLIAATSGGGKTTLMIQALLAQRAKASFLGRSASAGYSFVMLGADRGPQDHMRTMESMHLPINTFPFERVPITALDRSAVQIVVNLIETLTPMPEIIFIEGLDMMVTNVNDMRIVSSFLNGLQKVAEHYHITIIGSVGSPKAKEGHAYNITRENILGSGAWGRGSATVLTMQFPKGDDSTGQRIVKVLPRRAKSEKFTMEFQDGLLVVVPDDPNEQTEMGGKLSKQISAEIDWFQAQARLAKTDPTKEWFTATDMEDAVHVPYSTVKRHIKEKHLPKKHIRRRTGPHVGKGAAEQYQWNASKSNPIWVDQQAQDAADQQEGFSLSE